MRDVLDAIVEQTREFVARAGFEDVVVGLSGGIDSSVVAAVAAQALGAPHVHGVLMPGPYSSDSSVIDAVMLAERLGISTLTLPIDEPYEAFDRVFEEAGQGELAGLASQNTQARCRMVCLMALSNARGWLVLNAGNRSEACMGYSTLYGDTAGAFAPIGGLLKTQVYELAECINATVPSATGQPPIPSHVLSKPPSAELAPGQEDEASLGIPYAELDRILAAHLDEGRDAAQLVGDGFAEAQVRLVLDRYAASAFKRAVEPPAAKLPAGAPGLRR